VHPQPRNSRSRSNMTSAYVGSSGGQSSELTAAGPTAPPLQRGSHSPMPRGCAVPTLAVRVALFRVIRGANVGRLWGELRSSRRPGLTRLRCSVASTDPCLTVVQLHSPMTRRGVTGTIRELLMQRKRLHGTSFHEDVDVCWRIDLRRAGQLSDIRHCVGGDRTLP
jgi:hypothetical protein